MERNKASEREFVRCALCGSQESRPFFTGRDLFLAKDEEFTVVRCVVCGLIYVNPRPTPEALAAYYPDDYLAYRKIPWEDVGIMGKGRGVWADVKNTIKKVILEEYYGYSFGSGSGKNKRGKNVFKMALVYPFLSKFRWMYYRTIPFVEGGKVLDIGCGNARYLAELKQLGWEACGVDINQACIRHAESAYGIKVYCGDAALQRLPDGSFDCITLWHFLEHSTDPAGILRECARIIKPGGLIVVGLPNCASLEAGWLKEKSILFDVPRHLYAFSPVTLRRLAAAAGLKKEKAVYTASFPSIIESLNISFRSQGMKKQINTDILLNPLVVFLDMAISWFHLSSTMIFYLKKE